MDGEDELFDITSLADLTLVPRLRRIVNSEFLGPLQDELASHGIEAA